MQAVAQGVPAVATDCVACTGMSAVVPTCPPMRDAFRETLRAAMQSSLTERPAIARRYADFAKSGLDWSALAPRFAELYRKII